MTLVEKMRRARESTVTAGGFRWTIRRPTDVEMVRARAEGTVEAYMPFVVGWAKGDGTAVSEIDLGVPGGDAHPLAFDPEACAEYLTDNASLLKPVVDAIVDSYMAHQQAIGVAAKN